MINTEYLTLLQSLLAPPSIHRFLKNKKISYSILLDLLYIEINSQVSMTKLSEYSGISTAAITGRTDRLKHLGYVDRKHDDDDRRQVFIELTNSGRHMLDQYRRCLECIISEMSEENLCKIRKSFYPDDGAVGGKLDAAYRV